MTINVKNFLKDKPKLSKMGEFQELQPIEGMEISAISADLYGTGRDDLCLFYFKDGTNYAAVYTNNSICSESITWNRKIRKSLVKALRNKNIHDQEKIDHILIKLDGSKQKKKNWSKCIITCFNGS